MPHRPDVRGESHYVMKRLLAISRHRLAQNTVLATGWQGIRVALQAVWVVLLARAIGPGGYGSFAGMAGLGRRDGIAHRPRFRDADDPGCFARPRAFRRGVEANALDLALASGVAVVAGSTCWWRRCLFRAPMSARGPTRRSACRSWSAFRSRSSPLTRSRCMSGWAGPVRYSR